VEARVAVVDRDQDFVGEFGARFLDARGGLWVRGEVRVLATGHVHDMDVPVLVAALVLAVKDVLARVRPLIREDAALRFARDGFGGVEVIDGRDPHVHHAVHRRLVCEMLAVRADAELRAVGIAEQHITRDQRLASAARTTVVDESMAARVRRPIVNFMRFSVSSSVRVSTRQPHGSCSVLALGSVVARDDRANFEVFRVSNPCARRVGTGWKPVIQLRQCFPG
jgi:hypothetical protein